MTRQQRHSGAQLLAGFHSTRDLSPWIEEYRSDIVFGVDTWNPVIAAAVKDYAQGAQEKYPGIGPEPSRRPHAARLPYVGLDRSHNGSR